MLDEAREYTTPNAVPAIIATAKTPIPITAIIFFLYLIQKSFTFNKIFFIAIYNA